MPGKIDVRPAKFSNGEVGFIMANDGYSEWGNLNLGGDTLFSAQAALGVANLQELPARLGPNDTSQTFPYEILEVKSISVGGDGWARLTVTAKDDKGNMLSRDVYTPTKLW